MRTELKFVYGLQSDEFGQWLLSHNSCTDFVGQTCVEVMWCQAEIHNKNKLTACGEHGMENNTLLKEEQIIKQKFRNFWHLSHSKMFSYQPTVVSVAYLFSTRSKIALKDMGNDVSAESEFFVLSYWFNFYTYLITWETCTHWNWMHSPN